MKWRGLSPVLTEKLKDRTAQLMTEIEEAGIELNEGAMKAILDHIYSTAVEAKAEGRIEGRYLIG